MKFKEGLSKIFQFENFIYLYKGFKIGVAGNLGLCLLFRIRIIKKRIEIFELEERLYMKEKVNSAKNDEDNLKRFIVHSYTEFFYSKMLLLLDKL